MFTTLLVFILMLGLLIFVHEAGHFFAARAAGIKVEEFAFGFPPRLFSWVRGETRYAINLLPIGGYVKLLGEDGTSSDPRAFGKQSVLRRLGVIVAGVVMNLLLAIVVLWIGFSIGMVPIVSDPASFGGTQDSQIFVTGTVLHSPAEQAGLKAGDLLVGFGSTQELQTYTRANAGKTVELTIKRGGDELKVPVMLASGTDSPLGVNIYPFTKVKLPIFSALKASVIETYRTVDATFELLGKFFIGLFSQGIEATDGVSGPVGIYKITGQAVDLGLSYVLQLLGSLSINLALLNILPIPALDGGRALFVALEGIVRRKVVREEIEMVIHAIGFIFLMAIIILVTYKDLFGQ